MEILVVISIIALLLAILIPALARARSTAMQVKCASNLKQIGLAVDFYLNANNDLYPCTQDPVSLNPFYWLWMGRGWRSFVKPYLDSSISEDNPSVLFCPQDKSKDYESTSYAYSMSFYHSPEQIDSMNSKDDTYTNPQPSIAQSSLNVARASEKILIGEWFSNHRRTKDKDDGWWCWQGWRNYLFADGHVSFINAKKIQPARDGYPDINLTVRGIRGFDYPSSAEN